MIRTLKLLLLYLVMAALPLQGMAAVMKQACAPDPARQTASDSRAVKKAQHRVKARSAKAHGAAGAQEPAASHPAQHDDSGCGACLGCCVGGAAPPLAEAGRTPHDSTEQYLSSHHSLLAGYIPDGIERPPREIFG